MTRQKPTIDDVASLAGVARTTVSRVLNNVPNVRDEVRDRVRRAVAMLDYKVNVQARNLAGGSSRQIALIQASDFDTEPNSFYNAGLELGALRACAAHGWHLVTHTVNQNGASPGQQILAIFADERFEGIVLTPPFSDDVALVTALRANGRPVVCVSASDAVRQIAPSVGIDDAAAGYTMGEYVVGLGHRRFAFIKGLSGHLSAESRFDGFMRALQAAGIAADSVRVDRGNFTFHSGIEAANRLLADAARRPTALVCANDDMAAGALLSIHKLGLEIPRDISVTGFDDSPVSEIVWPPLTTIHQPIKTIGQKCVELVVQAVAGEAAASLPGGAPVAFRLVKRESAAPPK